MRALLMYRDRDFDVQQSRPWNETVLTQDLELNTLLAAMASDDRFLFEVARAAVLCSLQNDVEVVLYRQEILKDCFANPELIRGLYALTVEATENTKRMWWDLSSHYPDSVLFGAVSLLDALLEILRKLRNIAQETAGQFQSVGFTALFSTLRSELGNEYLATIEQYLTDLKFRNGTLVSAELGENNEGKNYMLVRPPKREPNWFKRMLAKGPPGYTFHLDPHDEAGARIVSGMRQHGISRVAITLAQSAEHVLNFFKSLKTELAFYMGCMNLRDKLVAKGESVCFSVPVPANKRIHRFRGLYDVCLALHLDHKLVGNEADANGKSLTIITGANQGGKSSFLRSIGVAQLMMQCGMFVGAEMFEAELCTGLFTHYKREEDATLKSGKLDEELVRMSEIADHITPDSILLLNESFAATNEREGSEIATQVVSALTEKRIKIFFVTHLYEFARGFFERKAEGALFLRAERLADGTRTFKLFEHEPLETSYGEDMYREIFGEKGVREITDTGEVGLPTQDEPIRPVVS